MVEKVIYIFPPNKEVVALNGLLSTHAPLGVVVQLT